MSFENPLKKEVANEAEYIEVETENGEEIKLRTDKKAFESIGLGHLHEQLNRNLRIKVGNEMHIINIKGIGSKFGTQEDDLANDPNTAIWAIVDGEGGVSHIDKQKIREWGLQASS